MLVTWLKIQAVDLLLDECVCVIMTCRWNPELAGEMAQLGKAPRRDIGLLLCGPRGLLLSAICVHCLRHWLISGQNADRGRSTKRVQTDVCVYCCSRRAEVTCSVSPYASNPRHCHSLGLNLVQALVIFLSPTFGFFFFFDARD